MMFVFPSSLTKNN